VSWFQRAAKAAPQRASCRGCAHFLNDPLEMERLLPGLASFCSGSASVRADDGVCRLHDRYLRASDHCDQWQNRTVESGD